MTVLPVNNRRSDISKLIQLVKLDAIRRNKKIETIDPIIKIGKNLFPLLSQRELTEYAQMTLRIILREPESQTHQTTLFSHLQAD